jgi:hypothetical protein
MALWIFEAGGVNFGVAHFTWAGWSTLKKTL